ncbi:MAG: nicotinate-nucleotide diphosphorylase (carboxylating) [Candidatus Magasanikbacteria bacterium RIFCSPLOWO2_12_FULL_47_9b]|nr:MAG: nicotinate-nucleotide diphosphorylase (carboxylating) [Candidatus Magasanikbacteria bacterium RIFCSPLOWO2_02_FULL_47_16]OGH80196.1 MAG: nicotinate-nucleotide diphosphorylase (carboxylating) [Candidatus Magasanikbacteria bacterium RIFCSPHIGHO2_02_FULL_48_18]OGH82847.1 MAG: nicotinate-nucleotide diphosphorylase (carboxylating) [Candidatus Magasanikbacteria bacterium RIFCSPLOWO2_12_FULL_47_9b]
MYRHQVDTLCSFFLTEDIRTRGDQAAGMLGVDRLPALASVRAKQEGVIAGMEELSWFLRRFPVTLTLHKVDKARVKKNERIMTIKGLAQDILQLERTVLNILQRMSGIATMTDALVQQMNSKALLCSTRKTQWGLLDKKAVVIGGGGTHRLGLYDFPLVKDNHITLMDEKRKYILFEKLKKQKNFWEIEVKNKKQIFEFLPLMPGAIMFDNFKPNDIAAILPQLKAQPRCKDIIFEASGGISEKNISAYAMTGVDIISVGALTHSVKALDMSLDIEGIEA